ncbi:MAG TPA: hypothetical protein VN112_00580 [Ensifer sp.]|nr:hypothetical protein [Ensifer sp.]
MFGARPDPAVNGALPFLLPAHGGANAGGVPAVLGRARSLVNPASSIKGDMSRQTCEIRDFGKYGEILQLFASTPCNACSDIKHWPKFDPIPEKMWRSDLTIVPKPHGIISARAGRL